MGGRGPFLLLAAAIRSPTAKGQKQDGPTLLWTLQVVFCDTVAAFDPTRSVLEIKTLLSKTRSTFRDGQNCC